MLECEKDPGWQFLRHSREKILEFQNKPYDSKKNFWVPVSSLRRKLDFILLILCKYYWFKKKQLLNHKICTGY
jgi:hypothetical protein